jgi:foldase protein PrsA
LAITVNGETIPQELIELEIERAAKLPGWLSIADAAERDGRIRDAATDSVIDRVLIRQFAESDPAPIESREIEEQLKQRYAQTGFREINRENVAKLIEQQLRLERAMRQLTGDLAPAEIEEARRFYEENRSHFTAGEILNAAHIVIHINETCDEADARQKIERALIELVSGEPFATVAAKHSDCPGDGGELGEFARGVMVDEFEEVVFKLAPGERSGIFRTPFGFHIAEVREREQKPVEFEVAAGQILEYLNMRRQQNAMSEAMQVLRSGARISANLGREADASSADV